MWELGYNINKQAVTCLVIKDTLRTGFMMTHGEGKVDGVGGDCKQNVSV